LRRGKEKGKEKSKMCKRENNTNKKCFGGKKQPLNFSLGH